MILPEHTYLLFNGAGLAGVVVYLGAYAALQAGVIRSGYLYASLNIVAAALVLVSLYANFNLSSAIIQISYILISVVGIARIYLLTTAIRFTPDERALLEAKLPGASKLGARRFLDAGQWIDAPPGTVLIREGQTHGILIYLASGTAEAHVAGRHVGTVRAGGFLGEMTALEGVPASATVTLTHPARYLRVEAQALKRLMARDEDLRAHIDHAIAHDTRVKLLAANKRLQELSGTD